MIEIPTEPIDPTFAPNLLDWEQNDIRFAHRWAYQAIRAAALLLDPTRPGYEGDWEAKDRPRALLYRRWFDGITVPDANRSDYLTRIQTVTHTFRKMAELMSTKSIVYQKQENCSDKMLANTKGQQGGPINLCAVLFNDAALLWQYGGADWARAMTLVHETSHAVVGGTVDVADGSSKDECLKLARDKPSDAVRNAQNYALFAMECQEDRPRAEQPNFGMWVQKGTIGQNSNSSRGPGAAVVGEDILMLAYPEPEPPKASFDDDDVGGRIWFKTLDLHEGREDWSDATLMQGSGEIRSFTEPALAVLGSRIYCAYIDRRLHRNSRLMYVSAETNRSSAPTRGLSPYPPQWRLDLRWDEPREIASDVDLYEGPALAVFSGGESSGIYCAYKKSGQLKCAVRLWTEGASNVDVPSGFLHFDFDKPRKSASAPALIVFNGQLRCFYRDQEHGYVTLIYHPAAGNPAIKNPRPGTWHEDQNSNLRLETKTIALAQWNTPRGTLLVALGRGKGDDRTLRYVCARPVSEINPRYDVSNPPDPWWEHEVETRACRTSYGSALVAWGSVLHSFHRHEEGWIDWMTATMSKKR